MLGDVLVRATSRPERLRVPLAVASIGMAFAALVAASLSGKAREGTTNPAPLQVVADAVLIDGRCRELRVSIGVLLKYGADHGLPAADILPLGSSRPSLEEAIARRADAVDPQQVCTTVAEQEEQLVPGLVTRP